MVGFLVLFKVCGELIDSPITGRRRDLRKGRKDGAREDTVTLGLDVSLSRARVISIAII